MITNFKLNISKIINHNGFQRYFKNTSWLFAEKVLRLIANLFVGIYVVRYFGPEKFGIYSYPIAFVGLFTAISKLGLDSITVKELVNHKNKTDIYIGTVFWLKFFGAILTLMIIGIVVQFLPHDSTTNLYIFIIACGLIFQSFEVIDFYFQSKVLSKYVSICNIIQLFISSTLKLYLIFIKAELLWFVVVILIDYISLAIALLIIYWKKRSMKFLTYFNFKTAKTMLTNSWPLIFAGIAVTIYMKIDQIMIKNMLNEKNLGLYSSAVKLSETWYFIPVIIASSLFPAILNAKQKSEKLYYKRLKKLYSLMIWLALIVAIPISFFSKIIITFLFGEIYKGASDVLSIYIWAGIFVSLGVASSKWLLAENLQVISFKNTVIGALINIIINYFLIPINGITGAAIATVISQLFAGYLGLLFYKNTRQHFYLLTKAFNPRDLLNIK